MTSGNLSDVVIILLNLGASEDGIVKREWQRLCHFCR